MRFTTLFFSLLFSATLFAAQDGIGQLPTTGSPTGLAIVNEINSEILAVSTQQAGATDPTTNGGAYSLWADTGNSLWKMRNNLNTGWWTIAPLGSQLAPLGSPGLTGTPTAPTAANGTNTTQLATTQFVQSAMSTGVAAKASTLAAGGGGGTAMTFNWSGVGGQPSWLWGGNDSANMYVYNPSNFNVNYANSSNYANTSGSANNQATGAAANPGWTNVNQGSGLKIRYGTYNIGDVSGSGNAQVSVSYTAVTNLIGVYISMHDYNGVDVSATCWTNSWTNSSFNIRCGETASRVQNLVVSWMVLGN